MLRDASGVFYFGYKCKSYAINGFKTMLGDTSGG